MSLTPVLKYDILDTYDSRIVRLADISDWKHLQQEKSFVDITVPGSSRPTTQIYQKNSINILNSSSLGITHGDTLESLPDGIYTFRIYICNGDKFCYESRYLRTVKTMLRLDQILINAKLSCCMTDKQMLEKYSEIELYIKGAHAHLRDGDIQEASCLYERALEVLDKFELCLEQKC